jgi:hypothetical protein
MVQPEQPRPDEPGRLLEVAQAGGVVAVANVAAALETRPGGYLPAEFIAGREETWVPRDGRPVWLGCSDEGRIDPFSAEEFRKADPAALDPAEGYLSVFGQVPGIAKNILAVGIAVYGDRFYGQVGGFDGVRDRLQRFMTADSSSLVVRPAAHTDVTKENAAFDALESVAAAGGIEIPTDATFCNHGMAATGCAYCGGVGATSELIATNPLVHEVIADDLEHIFGDDSLAQLLIDAHAKVTEKIGADFKFNRQAYVEAGLPVMVLERKGGEGDKHLAAADTGAIVNLDPTEIGNASKADAYRLDVAGAALLVRRVFKEYDLPANLLIASLVADAVAVRTVLAMHDASGDTTPDPRRIALGVRGGTIQQALAKIAQLEHL